MWDQRYSDAEYAYGKEANEFLKQTVEKIPNGKVLCLGEGEGRNALFLAKSGYDVTAVDYSIEGLKKAEQLAKENNVSLNLIQADLTQHQFEKNYWQGIVSIYCHLPKDQQIKLFQKCVDALDKGGVFILEGFSPRQLKYKTGGPKNPDFLLELEDIKSGLDGLKIEVAHEIERDVVEGLYHTGLASVIQLIGVKE